MAGIAGETGKTHGQAERKGRDWSAMTDRRAFDGSLTEVQGSLFPSLPDKATAGDVPLFMARASEELRDYWSAHARMNVTGYRRQLADARRAQAGERERDSVTLPASGEELVELVRVHGDAILNGYEAAGIDEYVDAAEAAAWFGLAVKTVYIEMSPSRNRWPQPDKRFGRAGAWARRTLVLHRAHMTGQGAPGKPRAKRKVSQ